MKVLVCGGRDYSDRQRVFHTLDLLHKQTLVTMLIHGWARGADSLAMCWAFERKVPCLSVPANWPLYQKRAGPTRNAEMLTYGPDLVVAFRGGSGTKNMRKQAQKAGVRVIDVSVVEDRLQSIPTIDSFHGRWRFLSNFHPAPIVFEGIQYATTEHAYQAAKALDHKQKLYVASMPTPGKAKRAGRNVDIREDWEDIKIDVMRACLRLKFMQGTQLANLLAQTAPAQLVEGNSWGDTFWGQCEGKGENHLGKLLMERRQELLDFSKTQKSFGNLI